MSAEVQAPHVFRWDLDKTYLKTEFESVSDLVRTARQKADERENVPGSAALIRAIRDDGGDHKVYFISGSPSQMRTVLEQKFALDGFMPDGFVLKPTLGHMMRGRFRAVRGQVAYKLTQLLLGRADVPVGVQETLFGDDAESDAFVYALYADLLAGKVPHGELEALLKLSGAYAVQMEEVFDALRWVVHDAPVRRTVIHLDQRTPPATFAPFAPLCLPIHNHLQTAIILHLDGTLGPGCIRSVGRELLAKYGFDARGLANLAEDIVRRRIFEAAPKARLAEAIRQLIGLDDGEEPAARRADINRETDEMLEGLAQRVDRLPLRPTGDIVEPSPRDYRALWREERTRRIARKRLRRLAAKAARRSQ